MSAIIEFFRFWLAYFVYVWGGVRRYVGNSNGLRREYLAAVRSFDLAYRIDPSFQRAKLDKAILLWRELDRPQEALEALNQLLRDDGAYAAALFNRALIYQSLWRIQPAVEDLEKYIALNQIDDAYWEMAVRNLAELRTAFDELDRKSQGDNGL